MSRSNFMVVPPLQRAIFPRAPGPADGCLMGPVQNVLSLVYHRNRNFYLNLAVCVGDALCCGVCRSSGSKEVRLH